MGFKPLGGTPAGLKTRDKTGLEDSNESGKPLTKDEVVKATEERIAIVYDDSGSMGSKVRSSANAEGEMKTKEQLATEGTIEYLRYCKPAITAVQIRPLNEEALSLTKNLPLLGAKLKVKEWKHGSTPLYTALADTTAEARESRFTRLLCFTDGEPTDHYPEGLFERMKDLKIPIDFIIIRDYDGLEAPKPMTKHEEDFKALCEATGGTFLITKDAMKFKEQMKYFAPLLRHMLPAIASEES